MRVLSFVVLAGWVLTLVRTLLNLSVVPRLQPRLPRRLPLVSVVIPARNEERSIARTVRALLGQTWPRLEIIVVDDRSTDSTGKILSGICSGDERVTVVSGEEPPPGWLGKPWALQQGSLRARGELLLFMDADVIYSPDAVTAAVARMEDTDAALLTLLPRVEMHGLWEKLAMPNLAVVAFSFLPLWLSNRSTIPIIAVGGGTGNLVRRDPYLAAGAHEALKNAVVDDVGLARMLRRRGCHTEVVRAEHLVSIRMYHGGREIVEGFTKNTFAVFGRSFLVASSVLLLGLLFHGAPYVLAAGGDRLSLVTLALIAASRLVLFRSVGYGTINAVFGHLPMMAIWFYILLRSVWFTGVLRKLHWRGRSYDAGRTRFGAD